MSSSGSMTNGNDLKLTLPVADGYPILLVTGDDLRHERFAIRMLAEFPEQIVGWLQLATANDAVTQQPNQRLQERRTLQEFIRGTRAVISSLLRQYQNGTGESGGLRSRTQLSGSRESLQATERKIFGKEIERFRKNGTLWPITVDNAESDLVLARIERLNPCFILAYCNSPCIPNLRKAFSGMILSQSDLADPELGASPSVYWALYHRDLSKIVSSVRVWRNGGDQGMVVRCSSPCFAVDDTPETCFLRESAVGTELMCEVVSNLLRTKSVRLDGCQSNEAAEMFHSPPSEIRREVAVDLRKGLIRREVARKMMF